MKRDPPSPCPQQRLCNIAQFRRFVRKIGVNIISSAVHFRSYPKALLSKAWDLLGALKLKLALVLGGIGPSSNVEGNQPHSLADHPQPSRVGTLV